MREPGSSDGTPAEADAEFSADRVGVNVDIGATLGIGGGIKLDIGFDPPWWPGPTDQPPTLRKRAT